MKKEMVRVLCADDSATARVLIRAALARDPALQVVAEAADGVEALELTKQLRPDVVTMDVHMPRMTGWEATRRIMVEAPTPIVIVSAQVDPSSVSDCMEALAHGALAVLAKPPGPQAPGFEAGSRRFAQMVKAMADVKVVRRWRGDARAPARGAPWAGPAEVLAIAASTGGPAALQRILSALPHRFRVPILVVQHMTPGFTDGLARWLDAHTPLTVRVARDQEPLEGGTVFIAPDDAHLGLSGRDTAALSPSAPVRGFRPSADHLFESVGRAFGRAALAVVLTGMGDDGAQGLVRLKSSGGHVLAQDEATSVVFGMPGAAVAAGVADEVLALDALPARIATLAGAAGGAP